MIHKFGFIIVVSWLQTTSVLAQVPGSSNSGIEGTPYLDESFVQGEIYFAGTSRKASIRYNIFQDLIEYQQGGQILALDPGSIKKVEIGSMVLVVQPIEIKGKTKPGFLALLDSGKVMLYSKKVVIYRAAKKGGALDGTDSPARYTRLPDEFYYKVGEGPLREVESIKSLIASFPEKENELTVFAKKEKLSPRKEKSLLQLVQYLNSL
jgi:hypothetical protein